MRTHARTASLASNADRERTRGIARRVRSRWLLVRSRWLLVRSRVGKRLLLLYLLASNAANFLILLMLLRKHLPPAPSLGC